MEESVLGIDIGMNNFAVTRVSEQGVEYFHFDISLSAKHYDNIPAAVGAILDMVSSPNSTLYIEDQLCKNTTCIRLQASVEAIAYTRGIRYERVSARSKYAWIQQLPRYCTGRVNKRSLSNQASKCINNVRSFIFDGSRIVELNSAPSKLDDVVDSVLICVAYYANTNDKSKRISKSNRKSNEKLEEILAYIYREMRNIFS